MSESDKYELPKDEKDPVQEAALLTIIKRYVDFSEKVCKELGLSGGWTQCSREYNGKRYSVIVAEYEHCPVKELRRLSRGLAGRDPAKLDALVEQARNAVSALDATISPGMVSDIDLQGIYKDIVNAKFRLKSALVAFEGRVVPTGAEPVAETTTGRKYK